MHPQPEEVAWHAFLTDEEVEERLPGWDVVPDGLERRLRLRRRHRDHPEA